jgi:hypothetical protein
LIFPDNIGALTAICRMAHTSRDTRGTPAMADTLIPVDDEEALPEHLTGLTEKQHLFVVNYVRNGGKAGLAAKAAGYAPDCAHVTASRMLRNPKVLHALQTETVVQLARHVPAALHKVRRLALTAKSEYVALEASRDLLDRAGFTAPKKVQVSGGVSVSIDLS